MPQRTLLTARPDHDSYVFRLAGAGGAPLERHDHHEIEANVIIAGTATCVVRDDQGDDHAIELAPGRMLLLGAGIEHALVRSSGDFAMWVCWWRIRTVRRLDAELGVAALAATHWSVLEQPRTDARRLDELLAQAAQCATTGKRLRLEALMSEAWCRIRSTSAAQAGIEGLHPAVARALAELAAHPHLPIRALATRCRLSPNRLSALFSAAMGCTISRWRIGVRLERLVATFDPQRQRLTDAALAAGFGSYARFHVAFVQRYGCTPRTWFRSRPG